jgi:hypothetical protein
MSFYCRPPCRLSLGVTYMLTVWVLLLSLAFIACIELGSYCQSLQGPIASVHYAKWVSHALSQDYFVLLRASKFTMLDMFLLSR